MLAFLVFLLMVIVLIIVLSLYSTLNPHKKERFQQKPAPPKTVVYTTNRMNYDIWITKVGKKKWQPKSLSLEGGAAVYKHILEQGKFPDNLVEGDTPTVWIASEMEYEYYIKRMGEKELLATQDAYFVGIGIPEEMFVLECAYDLKGRRIGYMDLMDKHFISCIMRGYRIENTEVDVVEVPIQEWEHLNEYMKKKEIDMIVTHIVPNSPLNVMLKMQYVSIVGWQKLDIDRLKLFNPFLIKEEVELRQMFMSDDLRNNALVMDREKKGPIIKTKIGMYALNGVKLPVDTTEGFITRLEVSEDAYDPSYRCYGDANIEQKALCVSPFNAQGDPKRVPTKWDRPCVKNEDCPFFKANKNYVNERGGCMEGGVCEMPLGVLRTAFRTYDTSGPFAPFCYGCGQNSECCSKQSVPDYAFPNDYEERKKAGLSTFVSVF